MAFLKQGPYLIQLLLFNDLPSLSSQEILVESIKIIQDPTLESSFTLDFEPRFPSQLTQSFQLSSIDLLNQVVHLGLQLEGKWGKKVWNWWGGVLGACPISSTANWMSHFILSKNRDFFPQMQNSCCCTSQVVVRIQYSSTHTHKACRQAKTQRDNFVLLWVLPFLLHLQPSLFFSFLSIHVWPIHNVAIHPSIRCSCHSKEQSPEVQIS